MDIKNEYDRLYRFCFYKVRNTAAAEDITQEAFLKYFTHRGGTGGRDEAYLYTIAKNLCNDFFRKKQTEQLSDDFPEEDFSDVSERKLAVRQALEGLEPKQREVLLLRYGSELSVNETAAVMELSRFAVYRLEKAGLTEMKKLLILISN